MFEAESYWSTILYDGIDFGSSMFGVGFICGIIRVLLVEPKVGKWNAVCFETPIMMMLSLWLARQYRDSHHRLDPFQQQKHQRLTKNENKRRHQQSSSLRLMKILLLATAFTTLLLWEIMVSVLVFGKSIPATIHDLLLTREGRLGVAIQLLCSFCPIL
jgi:hypothetical protein